MKTDREIAIEARNWRHNAQDVGVADACEKAIRLARQYGALPAPAAPLTFVEQAAIAIMQGYVSNPDRMCCDPTPPFGEIVAAWAVDWAASLEAALKKGGAA